MDINISPYLTDALPPGLTMSPSDLHEIKAVPADAQGSLMSSFSVAKKPRKTRAKFSKVRTGCITCKRRHVKCDETKPGCNRCIKWGGFCSGYEEPLARPSMTPERDSSKTASHRHSYPPASDYTFSSPSHNSYATFNSFMPSPSMSDTSSEGSGSPHQSPSTLDFGADVFDAAFWRDVVPSLIRDNAAVRYANLAVHALILAKQPSIMESRISNGRNQYGGALSFYGLALREVRQSNADQGDLRAAVLCSMFFVIFEIINGDRPAADAHLYSGRRMLDELRQVQGLVVPGIDNGAECLRRELRNVLRYLALQYGNLLDVGGGSESGATSGGGGGFLDEMIRGDFYTRISAATMPALSSLEEPNWAGEMGQTSIGV